MGFWVIGGAGSKRMRPTRWSLTLGDLVRVVSQLSRDDHETSLVVADLIQRGLVKPLGSQWSGRTSEVGDHVQSIYKTTANGWDKNRNLSASQAVRVFTYYRTRRSVRS
jgi:hypothetical protein